MADVQQVKMSVGEDQPLTGGPKCLALANGFL
jgi:hypothetical protein